jgi:hypothetical protein
MGGYIGSEKTVALYDSYTKKETDELNESSTRMLLNRSYAAAGLTLVAGSFEEGATVTLKTEVVWQQATGKVFAWFQDATMTWKHWTKRWMPTTPKPAMIFLSM